jgi:hypothetical protein
MAVVNNKMVSKSSFVVIREPQTVYHNSSTDRDPPAMEIPQFSLTDNKVTLTMKIPLADITGCPFCLSDFKATSFSSRNSFQRHLTKLHRVDNVNNVFSCRLCGFAETKTKYPLKEINSHVAMSHMKSGESSAFPCSLCKRIFPSVSALKTHQTEHVDTHVTRAKRVLRDVIDDERELIPSYKKRRIDPPTKQTTHSPPETNKTLTPSIKRFRAADAAPTPSINSTPTQINNTTTPNVDLTNFLNIVSNPNVEEIASVDSWLSDDTIYFYLTLLCSRSIGWSVIHPQVSVLMSSNPRDTKLYLRNVGAAPRVLLPYLIDGNHWVLFVLYFETKVIKFYDSCYGQLPKERARQVLKIASYIFRSICPWNVVASLGHLRQKEKDFSSCGPLICHYAKILVCNDLDVTVNVEPVGLRQEMISDILDPSRLTLLKQTSADITKSLPVPTTSVCGNTNTGPSCNLKTVSNTNQSWRNAIFVGELSQRETQYSLLLRDINVENSWDDFLKVIDTVVVDIKGDSRFVQPPVRPYKPPRPTVPLEGFNSKEAGRVQRSYMRSKKRTMSEILGNASPPCDLPVQQVENYFTDVFKAPDNELVNDYENLAHEFLTKDDVSPAFVCPFTPAEVEATLRGLKNSAPGEDGIMYSEIRKFDPSGRILAYVYNLCKEARRVPSSWKTSVITLIHKKGDRNNLSNWRPISLGNTLYKLYTKLWSNRLMDQLKTRLSSEQKGFMANEGCLEHIFVLDTALNTAKNDKRDLAVAWLDLCNAFGSVPHKLISCNLRQLGFPQSFIDIVLDIYKDSTCKVRVGSSTTKPINVERGVKQGDPLSPLLFNIAIEPVLQLVKKQFNNAAFECLDVKQIIMAYADDIALTCKDVKSLQECLLAIQALMRRMRIEINPKKCGTLCLSRGKVTPNCVKLQEATIPALDVGDFYQYLGRPIGINIDRTPTAMLKTFICDLYKINRSLLSGWQKLDAIKTFVIPRLSFILRNGDIPRKALKEVDRALFDVIRRICNLPKSTSIHYLRGCTSRGGLGVLGAMEEQEVNVVTHAFRLLTSPVENIKTLAWNSLRKNAESCLGRVLSDEELGEYLTGKTDGVFCRLNSRGSCLWSRVRPMARRLREKIQSTFVCSPHNEVRLVYKHPLHPNAHLHADGRQYTCSSLRHCVFGYHEEVLRTGCKDQGRAFSQISKDKSNNMFVRDGKFISHASFKWIHSARVNQLAVNAAPGRGMKRPFSDSLCRRCNDGQRETLAHILCHCRVHLAKAITARHNIVQSHFERLLRTKFPTADISIGGTCGVAGRALKPDIVVVDADSKSAYIFDVRCPFEGSTNSFVNARIEKQLKYEPERKAFQDRGFRTVCDAFLVGALGSWDPLNDAVLKCVGFKSPDLKLFKRRVIADTIDVSRCIYWEHVLGERYVQFGRFRSTC